MAKSRIFAPMAKRRKKKSRLWLVLGLLALLGLIASSIYAYRIYRYVYARNVELTTDYRFFYVGSEDNYEDVKQNLIDQEIILDLNAFEWVAARKKYPRFVQAGRYRIRNKMSNNALVNLLRSGMQEPLRITLNNIQTKADLCGNVASKLELDSADLMKHLSDNEYLKSFGFDAQKILAMFIPNTYEFYWNTSVEDFMVRMAGEYKLFWNEERKSKAAALKLSQTEVSTLASIVQKETFRADEKARVAGLYLNRVRKGMKLQADPTVIYALGDFSIKRVLKQHLSVDSPFNTYRHAGIPPAPICLPEISSIDAVLNAEKHNYIFMCAKEDFSGYHNFASNLREHNQNARRYQRALNERKIYR